MSKYIQLALVVAVAALSITPACANLLMNGTFENGLTGWSSWQSSWSGGNTATVTAEAGYGGGNGLKLSITSVAWAPGASFGVYQQVSVTPGQTYKLDGMWKGMNGSGNWFEIILIDGAFNVDQADDPAVVFNNVVTGYDSNAAFGYPAPASFGWQSFASTYNQEVSPYISNGTRTATGNTMTVVLKIGSYGNPIKPSAYFDDITLTAVPEPAGLIALASGLGMLGFVRRRK